VFGDVLARCVNISLGDVAVASLLLLACVTPNSFRIISRTCAILLRGLSQKHEYRFYRFFLIFRYVCRQVRDRKIVKAPGCTV
jgi:hypothetical protein